MWMQHRQDRIIVAGWLRFRRWKQQALRDVSGRRRCYSPCTLAISRAIPHSFVNALSEHYNNTTADLAEATAVSLEVARQQHDTYLATLRTLVPVLCLPALEEYPDCVFVEDTVVAVGKRAVLTRPGHPSRQGEVDSIHHLLQQQLGMDVVDMRQVSPSTAICDGGDVLFTGRHLFVGLTERTNAAGAHVLGDALGLAPILVTLPTSASSSSSVLHLKSAITHLDPETLVAPAGAQWDQVVQSMLAGCAAAASSTAHKLGTSTSTLYEVIRLPNIQMCNVLPVHSTVMAQAVSSTTNTTLRDDIDKSRQILEDAAAQRGLTTVWISTSELAKKDAALTCCSVLLNI